MKKKVLQIFVLFPFAALLVVLTPLLVFLGTMWEHFTYRKVAVISDSLCAKGAPIDIAPIEALLIRVYPAGSVFKLKLRSGRPFGVLPASGQDLVAWAKRHDVCKTDALQNP